MIAGPAGCRYVMQLHVKCGFLKGFKGEKFERLRGYRDDNRFVDISADLLSTTQLDKLIELAKADIEKAAKTKGEDGEPGKSEGSRGLIQKIAAYRNIRNEPEGKPIGKLEALATALRAYIEPTPNKWAFHDEPDGYSVPFYVQSITYNPAKRDSPADVDVRLAAVTRGSSESKTVTFHRSDLGKTVSEILNKAGYYRETEDAVKAYLADIEVYKKFSPLTGSQYRSTGVGFPMSGYGYGEKSMDKDGIAATVVMDDVEDEDSSGRERSSGSLTTNAYWAKGPKDNGVDDEDEEFDEDEVEAVEGVDSVVTPVHPYVKVFDLNAHEFVLLHVRNLTPYVFDKSAAAKLVLPVETKELVTILVQGSSEILEDIIKGKTGGTIVIATGPPGTGKTLTAEVFSEEIERPLYVVQCSQLGTDEENIEKQLRKVLARASRWKAILLIDEADVYVHERGSDIQQNAIVGVFLRVLERYRGVLFLTSNRATIIDDAIMSRATAWIRYEYPTTDQLGMLWKVLSKQYRMELSNKAIDELIKEFPKVSGRNIKNLLKLAIMLVKGKKSTTIDVSLFKYVAKFLDLDTDDKKKRV